MTIQLTQVEHEALVKAIETLPGTVDCVFNMAHHAEVQHGNVITVCYVDIVRSEEGGDYETSISFEEIIEPENDSDDDEEDSDFSETTFGEDYK